MLGVFSGSTWNDENIKRFDAIEAKLETQSTLQNELLFFAKSSTLLQSKLSDKEEIINVLKDKVEQFEERHSKTSIEISDGNNMLQNEIKRFDAIEAKHETRSTLQNEQITLLQSKLSDKEEIINVLKDKVEQFKKDQTRPPPKKAASIMLKFYDDKESSIRASIHELSFNDHVERQRLGA